MLQKLRTALFLLALGLLAAGFLRAWGNILLVDAAMLAGGGLLLGLALCTSGGAKKPLPPAQPTSKSGA
ncbi:MAG: hypothetical protein JNL90_16410 [Planctomycetes bacterium]|nr:hypothetical protein [Planctomycetota bacterium]